MDKKRSVNPEYDSGSGTKKEGIYGGRITADRFAAVFCC